MPFIDKTFILNSFIMMMMMIEVLDLGTMTQNRAVKKGQWGNLLPESCLKI